MAHDSCCYFDRINEINTARERGAQLLSRKIRLDDTAVPCGRKESGEKQPSYQDRDLSHKLIKGSVVLIDGVNTNKTNNK